MILIVGIGIGDAGEEILIGLAGQQIAVVERFLAEIGQQRVARGIGDNGEAARLDRLGILLALLRCLGHGAHCAGKRIGA